MMIGDNLSGESRLTKLLQSQPNVNNGTIYGGLAHVLKQALMGYEGGKDSRSQQAATDAYVRGMTAQPWTNPDTGEVAPAGSAGGQAGAMAALQGQQNNPYARNLAMQLMMEQAQGQAAESQWQNRFDAQNQAQDQRFDKQSAAQDARLQQQLAAQDSRLNRQIAAERELQALKQQNEPPKPSYGQKAMDQAYGKEYVTDVASGGLADAEKNIQQLQVVADKLNAGKEDLTGGFASYLPDSVRNVTNPDAVNTRQQVEEVVQRNLRLILGAQFTQNEGMALIARAYNPKLDEKTNATRVTRLLNAMKVALTQKKAAANYFEQNGTLQGFQGVANFTQNDFNSALDNPALDNIQSATPSGGQSPQGNVPPPPPGFTIQGQ